MPEYQVFPRGSLLIMLAGILMIIGMIFLVILISYSLSFMVPKNTVATVVVGLVPLLAITAVTPGFMLTRGKAHWQKVIEVLNSVLMMLLLAGLVIALWMGDTGIAVTSSLGLLTLIVAWLCYRSARYQDGVEYYRRVWAAYRKQRTGVAFRE